MAVTAALASQVSLLGVLLLGAAINSAPALAGDQMPAACQGMTVDFMPPMPAPSGIKPDEPMPTAMAKPGTMQGNVMQSAAENEHCMHQKMGHDQSLSTTAPKQ